MAGLMILVSFLAAGAFAKRIATKHEQLQNQAVANGILPGAVQSALPLHLAAMPQAGFSGVPVSMSTKDGGTPLIQGFLQSLTEVVRETLFRGKKGAEPGGAPAAASPVVYWTPEAEQAAAPAPADWMDHLKFGGSTPTFDVIEKTQEYAACKTAEEAFQMYADDYVFRGPFIGPISGEDVRGYPKERLNIPNAYPNLDRGIFGFSIDPENPYRCLFFERWTATNTGTAKLGALSFPPTGKQVRTPLHVSSITWNPQGKIIYNSISPPVDRFEGNTKGNVGVYGLVSGAGVLAAELMLQQKVVQRLGIFGKQYSDEADIPAWWKSMARGAVSMTSDENAAPVYLTLEAEQAAAAAPADWMAHLKFGGSTPTFDVIEKTQEYAARSTAEEGFRLYADDYVFRGPFVGPISGDDVRDNQDNVANANPNLDREFGFTIDPENPYRCLFFERCMATNTLHVTSITWNPQGKIIYNSISPPVDRFEGNTNGNSAIFGLYSGAGFTTAQKQKAEKNLGIFGKQWSDEADIPAWWKSMARGADAGDI